MTDRLADIGRRIQGVQQLASVVGAMRAIAATRAQQSRGQLAGIRTYSESIALAIAQALRLLPAEGTPVRSRRSRHGLILFCAEQGFAGAFTERVLEAAGPELSGATLFLIGSRGGRIAAERGLTLTWQAPMASHVDGVKLLAMRLADALYDAMPVGGLTSVEVVFPTWTPGEGLAVERRSLLPLDPSHFAALPKGDAPLITLPARELVARLAEEYVYAVLCEAAMHAFSAENEARVAAMVRAKSNIETMLGALQARERQVRQEEITAEVVELAGGAGLLREMRT
jgi:F-type H+-transporting ATPase subunit gamma